MKVVRAPDPGGTELHTPTVSRLQTRLQVDPVFLEMEVFDLTTFKEVSLTLGASC